MSGRERAKVKREEVNILPWEKIGTAPFWTNAREFSELWKKLRGQVSDPAIQSQRLYTDIGQFMELFDITIKSKTKDVLLGDPHSVLKYRKVYVLFIETDSRGVSVEILELVRCNKNTAIILYGSAPLLSAAAVQFEDILRTEDHHTSLLYVFLSRDEMYGPRESQCLTVDKRVLIITKNSVQVHRSYIIIDMITETHSWLLMYLMQILDLPDSTGYHNLVYCPAQHQILDKVIELTG